MDSRESPSERKDDHFNKIEFDAGHWDQNARPPPKWESPEMVVLARELEVDVVTSTIWK